MESPTPILAQLRDTLADLYPSAEESRVIIADAGLDPRTIAFSPRAQTNWYNILAEAIRQQRLPALIAVVDKMYGDVPALQAAVTAYHAWLAQGGQLAPPAPLPADNLVQQIATGSGDVVGHDKNIHYHITYAQTNPQPVAATTLAAANAKLAELPVDHLPPIAPLPPGSHMPLRMNPLFVGRAEELRTLATTLKGGTTIAVGQIAAATGLGGIGKTQLAVAFVHHYGHFFQGGVHWLNFADPHAVPSQIATCGASMTGLPADFATRDLPTQVHLVLAAWQSPLPRLLVFDNCEDQTLLAHWQPPTGGSRLLLTSRRHHWDASLGVAVLPLDTLPRAESIRLLHKFRPDLPPTDPDLAAIAAELGDLPLALHLAGSFLRHYQHDIPPQRYLAQLRQPTLLHHRSLATSAHQPDADALSPTHHVQHVERTFALSYDRLQPDHPAHALARALLARAACFAPGQPIPRPLLLASSDLADSEAATLLAGDALTTLANLGLLTMTPTGAPLIHRLVAHFVQHADPTLIQTAPSAVAAALLAAARRINNAGLPGPLLLWQSHLRHLTDLIQSQNTEQAAGLCNELGLHLKMIGDYAAARPYYERALAIREQVLGPQHPATATSLNNLGLLLQTQGDYDAARPYYERALAIYEELLGPQHPATATSLNNLGLLLKTQGDYAAARPYYERALAIREEVLGANHPATATSLNNLGALLNAMGDSAAARPYYERALAIYEEVLGAKHPDTATSLNNLGLLLQTQGDYAAAQPYCERALAICEERLGSDHPDTQTVRQNLAQLGPQAQ